MTPHCFASVLLVATPDDGIIVSGSLGEFDIGVLQCDQALLDFRLTPTQQILKAYGGCEVPGLLDGSMNLYIGIDGVAFRGDIELFPDAAPGGAPFRATIEGEAAADLGQVDLSDPASLLALDFDLHAVLETEFTGAIQQALAPLIENLRLSAEVIDGVYSQLRSSGDLIQVILDLPDTIEAAGGDVPDWLEDFADGLDDFQDTLADYGIALPDINDVLGGFPFTVTEGVPGYYEPEHRECQTATLGLADGGLGTVIDGVCWDDPPGGPFNYEERGVFVNPSCRSAFDAAGRGDRRRLLGHPAPRGEHPRHRRHRPGRARGPRRRCSPRSTASSPSSSSGCRACPTTCRFPTCSRISPTRSRGRARPSTSSAPTSASTRPRARPTRSPRCDSSCRCSAPSSAWRRTGTSRSPRSTRPSGCSTTSSG